MSLLPYALDAGRYLLNNFAPRPRGRKATRGRKRGNNRRSGIARSRANTSSRVPTRSVTQGSFNGSIRNYFSIGSATSFYKSITRDDLLGDQFAALKTQFGECRIHSLRVYVQPDQPTSSSGLYASALIDSSTSKATTLSYGQILALPGSTCRKIFQTVGHHWKWTEPSDAEFRLSSDKNDVICEFFLHTNSDSVKVSGDLVVDTSLTLRSSPAAFTDECQLLRMLRIHPWSTDQLLDASHCIDNLLAAPLPPTDDERSISSAPSSSRIPVPISRIPRQNASIENCGPPHQQDPFGASTSLA